MIEAYYYLAAYTAAKAAGFSPSEACTIARSARCALSADHLGISGLIPALEYLPGDQEAAVSLADPGKLEDPSVAAGLALICSPSGTLAVRTVGWARKRYSGKEASRLQSVGIVLCVLANAQLHQGFTGFSDGTINAAADIKTARPLPREKLRAVLRGVLQGEALETLADMEAYEPSEAPASYLGAAQLSGLDQQPGALYCYQSPWRTNPTVECAGPLRFAKVYLMMRSVLPYVRTGKKSGILSTTEDLIDLACFLAEAPEDEGDFTSMWWRRFSWCEKGPEYAGPTYDKDRQFINEFGGRLTAYRDFALNEHAALGQAMGAAKEG